MSYQSDYSGAQVDEAVGKALNPDAAPTQDSTNLVQSGGVASAVSAVQNTVSRRNLLDNWYFVGGGSQQGGGQFPINQRGQTVYSAGDYGIDRWVMYAPAGNLQSDGLHFSTNESIAQNLESSLINALNGKTVTMSVLTSDGLFSGSIVYDKTVAQYFYAQGISLVKGVGGNGSNYAQVFTSSPTVVYAVKLELGSVSTLANDAPPNFAEELAKCQRYFIRLTAPAYGNGFGIGRAYSASDCMVFFPLPVSLRTSPTVVATGLGNCALSGNGGYYAVTSVSYSGRTENGVSLSFAASGITVNQLYMLWKAGSDNAYIDLSADL